MYIEHWHFDYQSCVDGHLGLSHTLTIFVNSAVANTDVQAPLWYLDLEFFG